METEVPYRQLMVDVVQAAFGSTYRSGDWPRRFQSHAARALASAIERRLADAGRGPDGETATALLEQASTWEDDRRPMVEAVGEFRALLGSEVSFPPPDLDALTNAAAASTVGDEEGTEDDDDIR